MNRFQQARMSMFRAVRAHCEAHAAVFAALPYFKDPYEAFKARIPLMEAALTQQDTPTAGSTADKRVKRQALLDLAIRFRVAMASYALFPPDPELQDSLPRNNHELIKAGADALLGKSTRIAQAAAPIIGGLAPFGIQPADLAALDAAIAAFSDAVTAPALARKSVREATAELGMLVNRAAALLRHQLDPAAHALRALHPEFVQQYFLVRELDDPAYRPLALRIHISDAATGEPVPGASVLVEPEGIRRNSSASGNCRVARVKPGIIRIIVQKAGYETGEVEAAVNEGERVEVVVRIGGE